MKKNTYWLIGFLILKPSNAILYLLFGGIPNLIVAILCGFAGGIALRIQLK